MQFEPSLTGYVLRLDLGEEVQKSLIEFAKQTNLQSAFYFGFGGIKQVKLGYFQIDKGDYAPTLFEKGLYELVNLTGNLTRVGPDPFPHTHLTMGDDKHQTYSGHLLSAIVGVTVEIMVITTGLSLTRTTDPKQKFKPLIFP